MTPEAAIATALRFYHRSHPGWHTERVKIEASVVLAGGVVRLGHADGEPVAYVKVRPDGQCTFTGCPS